MTDLDAIRKFLIAIRDRGNAAGLPQEDAFALLAEVDRLAAENARLTHALRVIAGLAPCTDTLMSNDEIAREALGASHDWPLLATQQNKS